MLKICIDEDLLEDARGVFAQYGQSVEEAILLYLERAVDFPFLPGEIALAELDPDLAEEGYADMEDCAPYGQY